MPDYKSNLGSVIPALATLLEQNLQTSERKAHYSAEITPLVEQLKSRFAELAPSPDELQLSIDMESKLAYEDQINQFLRLSVIPAYRLKTQQEEIPEFLLPRHKKTADFYTEAFAGIETLDKSVKDLISNESEGGISLTAAKEIYLKWKSIYEAQTTKGEIMQKVAEIVDIKQALIGMLRLLNVEPQEIQHAIYDAGQEE